MLRILTIIALVLGAGSTAAASTAEDAPPPALADACGSRSDWTNELQAEAFWLYTYDRVRLYAIDTRSGARTVVLAHGWGDDLCETLVIAGRLVANGYRVIAFDFRGSGRSQSPAKNWRRLGLDLAATVAHARRTGAQRIFLMGSSMGGAAIVQNTASLRVDGRISLSGTWLGLPSASTTHAGLRESARPSSSSGRAATAARPIGKRLTSSAESVQRTSALRPTRAESTAGRSSSTHRTGLGAGP